MTRPIRFLLSRENSVDPGVDWAMARRLRDAGFEVVLGGAQSPEQTAETACDEGVDLVGYGVGGNLAAVTHLVAHMRKCGIGGLPVVIGANLDESGEAALRELGVQEVFHPLEVTDESLKRFRALGRIAQSQRGPS